MRPPARHKRHVPALASAENWTGWIAGAPLWWPRDRPQILDGLNAAQGTGYSGIENPLFYRDNTRMFYGDAKTSIDQLLPALA